MYRLYLRSIGQVVHRQDFHADDDDAAVAIAGAVFHSTANHWDSYDLWNGDRLIGNTIVEKVDALADQVERAVIAIGESILCLDRFKKDKKLSARIEELRARRLRSSLPERDDR